MSCKCNGSTQVSSLDQAKLDQLEKYIGTLPLADNPDRARGFLIQTLHRAQSIFGYLPEEVQKFVACKLGLSPADVYGVISFYSFFTDKPLGRHKINVCTGTACFVKGATKVLDEFKRRLNVAEGETTADGKFFLGALRCVGACSLAPVVMVDDRVYGNMTADKVAEVLGDFDD